MEPNEASLVDCDATSSGIPQSNYLWKSTSAQCSLEAESHGKTVSGASMGATGKDDSRHKPTRTGQRNALFRVVQKRQGIVELDYWLDFVCSFNKTGQRGSIRRRFATTTTNRNHTDRIVLFCAKIAEWQNKAETRRTSVVREKMAEHKHRLMSR